MTSIGFCLIVLDRFTKVEHFIGTLESLETTHSSQAVNSETSRKALDGVLAAIASGVGAYGVARDLLVCGENGGSDVTIADGREKIEAGFEFELELEGKVEDDETLRRADAAEIRLGVVKGRLQAIKS